MNVPLGMRTVANAPFPLTSPVGRTCWHEYLNLNKLGVTCFRHEETSFRADLTIMALGGKVEKPC